MEEDHPQEAEQNETMNAAEAEEEQHEAEVIPVRWSSRIAREIVPPQWYIPLTKIKKATSKLEDEKEKAKFMAIQKES